jgi:hypothetical protein
MRRSSPELRAMKSRLAWVSITAFGSPVVPVV